MTSRAKLNAAQRLKIVFILLGLAAFGLIWRLIDLSVIDRHFLQNQYAERTIREIVIPSYRGMVTDRNGQPLAISTPVYAVWADPKTLLISNDQIHQLAALIDLPATQIKLLLLKDRLRQFVYLKRDIPPDIADQIKDLGIKGLYLERQYRRFYPEGESCAQLIGFTNIDDQGQEGIELAYNQWLQGSPGLKKVVKDRYGDDVQDLAIIHAPVPGHNLTLSIDNRIQYMAYQELLNGIQEFGAQSGSVVVLDIHTGEILAMANAPSYNPNARPTTENSNYRNRAVTDLFEPGSTMKPIAMTAALLSGRYNINSTVDTSPGYWYVDGKKIDDDGYNNGIVTMTKILQVSSNVGMSKVILSIPSAIFLNLIHALGYAQLTNSGFPGESPGVIDRNANYTPFVLATVSFGYGISANLLQIAQAYATLANNGVKIPVSLLKVANAPKGTLVINPAVTQQILTMLESVLEQGGTAVAAQVPGYRVTGKTGTARILGPHGYEKDHHNSIFVGIAPASHPELVVAVVLHDPLKKAYYGGFVAGPVFSRIMGESLRILNVPPDNVSATPMPLASPQTMTTMNEILADDRPD